MRLWSLHPKYLDAKGLVALWRETLLAKKVLENKTKGYRHHPQLIRFRNAKRSAAAINQYLSVVYDEALNRNYSFDKKKIGKTKFKGKISVTNGQLEYEVLHLKRKLKVRDLNKFRKISSVKNFLPHPLFRIKKGSVEEWEITE